MKNEPPRPGDDDTQRIRRLLESAARAGAQGFAQEAERLMRQAETEAPQHPLVLNEMARRQLLAGNADAARELLERAIQRDPSDASTWLNLAAALRGLGRPDAELAAIEAALAIDPSNLRAMLQRASLEELQGKSRAAAATYRLALQTLPPGFDPPPALLPLLKHAQGATAANDRALETFLEHRLQPLRERHAGEALGRFDRSLATLLRKHPVYRPQPTFLYFPQLPAIEFHARDEFPWLTSIESATDDIRGEFLNLLEDKTVPMRPYVDLSAGVPLNQWRELNRSPRWGVYFLWREGVAFQDHIARCPRTVAALQAWPRCDVPGCGPTAVFSVLDAKTHIPPHTGVANTRLIVHLPLIVPPGCVFRVGAERRRWQPGAALVFDDTFEHEAWNDGDAPRAVLILDIWNPLLSLAERDLVRTLTAGVGEYYGTGMYDQQS